MSVARLARMVAGPTTEITTLECAIRVLHVANFFSVDCVWLSSCTFFFEEHIQIFIFDLTLTEWCYNVLHGSTQCHDAFNQSSMIHRTRRSYYHKSKVLHYVDERFTIHEIWYAWLE